MMRCPTGAYSHGTTLWGQPSMTTCCLFLQLRHNVSTYHAFCPSLLQKCLPTSFLAEKPDTKPVLVCQSTPLTMNVWVWPSPGRQVTSALKLAQKLTAFRPPTVPWKVDTWIVGADTCLILLQNFPAACWLCQCSATWGPGYYRGMSNPRRSRRQDILTACTTIFVWFLCGLCVFSCSNYAKLLSARSVNESLPTVYSEHCWLIAIFFSRNSSCFHLCGWYVCVQLRPPCAGECTDCSCRNLHHTVESRDLIYFAARSWSTCMLLYCW